MADGHFHALGGHAQKSRHPHPEQGCRAAEKDGEGDATDVAGADGAGQGGGECLKVAGVPRRACLGMPPQQHAPGMAEVADLRKSQIEREEQANAQQQEGEVEGPAQQAIEKVDRGFEHEVSLSAQVADGRTSPRTARRKADSAP